MSTSTGNRGQGPGGGRRGCWPFRRGGGKAPAGGGPSEPPKPPPAQGVQPEQPFVVEGLVRSTSGAQRSDGVVRALARALTADAEVGNAQPDVNGRYRIEYHREQLRVGNARAALVLRFAGRDGAEAVESKPIFEPKPVETVNLTVGGVFRGPARHDALVETLRPMLQDVPIESLRQDGQRRDISFLAKATGANKIDVKFLVLAAKLAAKTGIDARVFFGFFKLKIPASLIASLSRARGVAYVDDTELDMILRGIVEQPEGNLRSAFRSAIRRNYIPDSLAKDEESVLAQLRAERVKLFSSLAFERGKTPISELIAVTTLPQQAQQTFLNLYSTRPSSRRAIRELSRQPGVTAEAVNDLRFTLATGGLVQNHLPLVQFVRKLKQEKRIEQVRELARFTADDWKGVLDEVDPEGKAIVFLMNVDLTDDERKRHFAEILAERFERRYPTTALSSRMEADRDAPLQSATGVVQFLKQNPAFQLRSMHIDRYLKDNKDALKGIDRSDEVVQDLKRTQRVFALMPRYSGVKALLANGIESAATVYFNGKTRFVAQMSGVQGLTKSQVEDIYVRAEQKYAIVLTWLGVFNAAFQLPLLSVGSTQPAAPEALAGFASLQSLFGSADFCECEHCNSVYGPAAYLADLLQFLKHRAANHPNTSAKDILLGRVPWIAQVELSCDNTNLPLPYIDLVCEVLEDAVSPAGAAAMRARQTTGTAEERRATPAFQNGNAYNALAGAVFPLILPFSLDAEQIRTFLGHLGVPWHRLMRRFQHRQGGNDVPAAADITAEALGIGAEEHPIIVGAVIAAHQNAWEFWGLQENNNHLINPRKPDDAVTIDGTWIEVLKHVPVFLQRAGIEYRELLQLIDSRFVRGNVAVDVADEQQDGVVRCDTANFVISGLNNNVASAAVLSRAQRFLRLWRKAGCAMWELDKVISSPRIGGGRVDDALLGNLACMLELAKRVSLPLDEMLAWWDNIESAKYVDRLSDDETPIKSVWERLFRNSSVAVPADNPFSADSGALAGSLTAVLPQVSAAISASIDDIGRIRKAAGIVDAPGNDTPLNLANLSILLRHASLARAMNVRIEELLLLIDVSGVDPFSSPARTVALMRLYDKLTEGGFTVYEVDYLLRHGSIDQAGLHLGDDVVTTAVAELRDGLQKIADENSLPARDVVRKRLAQRADLKDPKLVEQAITIVEGTWPGTQAQRDAFIDEHFAGFSVAADAKARLGPLAPGTPDAQAAEVETRYAYVAGNLIAAAQSDYVRQKISDVTTFPPNVLDSFFTGGTLPGSADTVRQTIAALLLRGADGKYTNNVDRATFGHLFDAFVILNKARAIIERLKLTAVETRWVVVNANAFGWLQLKDLPPGAGAAAVFDAFRKLVAGVRLKHEWRRTTTLFDALLAGDAATMAKASGWDSAALATLMTAFNLNAASLGDIDILRRLKSCFDTARVLGSSVDQCLALADPAAGHAGAKLARQLAKAKYRAEEWLAVAAPLEDGLREKKRDALVAWLLANPDPAQGKKWQKPDDLYAYFLIDPEMSSCQLTTRLKQAAASVQLFVQRCLMHIEPAVVADATADDDWLQWKWMKNYRVWEANRKVFLYPENWIEPELRKDKSPLFKKLENDITQNDITDDIAEDAFLTYLEGLADVSRLEVVAFVHEQHDSVDLLHVIGRTVTAPHVHYYRQRLGTGEWTAWDKIDLDINSDQVVAVIWNRRLHLLWPIFTEKSLDTKADKTFSIPSGGGGGQTAAPRKYWEIQLAWSERKRGKWLARRTTPQMLIDETYVDKSGFTFKAFPDRGTLTVDVFRLTSVLGRGTHPLHWGEFQIDGADSNARVFETSTLSGFGSDADGIADLPAVRRRGEVLLPWPLAQRGELMASSGVSPDALYVLEGPGFVSRLLCNTITRPVVCPPDTEAQFDARGPFFLHDPRRTFFVLPITPGRGRGSASGVTQVTPTVYRIDGHYHPFVSTFIRELNVGGLDALFKRRLQTHPEEFHPEPIFDVGQYHPTAVVTPYWKETVEFTNDGAYSPYNRETFLFGPWLLAARLTGNQRFDEALQWYHRIFDPTNTGSEPGGPPIPVPQRYWITKPFFEITDAQYQDQQIQKLMERIANGDPDLLSQVARWRDDPFDPHLIASMRPVAYQKSIVMKYLDNLIAWGDQLFRRDTIESINEATQLYILASDLLGPHPQRVRDRQPRQPRTYAELEAQLDAFSNELLEVENALAFPGWTAAAQNDVPKLPLLHVFYFCIPPNDKLLGYWDVVADRLFKIRHCMNIEGQVRQLPLYEPPIDPALLVRAAAAGVDLSTALSDINAPLPFYRFTFTVQKATELCNDLRAYGTALLQVLEKKDAEALGLLRSTREIALLEATRDVRQLQIDEAQRNREALDRQRDLVLARKTHYEQLQFMNPAETAALTLSTVALAIQAVAVVLDTTAGAAHLVPQFSLGASGFGGSPHAAAQTGGTSFGQSARAWAEVSRGLAGILTSSAAIASTLGTYQRRAEDWALQRQLAERELAQIEKQAAAADIRIAIAQLELRNQETQIDNARASDEFLRTKYTNAELYDWMIAQTATTYFQAYQLAYDVARRADRTFAYETGGSDAPFIQFGYWDSLRKGLLAGEKLLYDIKRMESAFYDRNARELEITKHVSLALHDPLALLMLRRNGQCNFKLPETLFDNDYPGHFMRRIKSVALTIPAVVGPYTSLNCTLTNVGSSIRISSNAQGNYARAVDGGGNDAPDPRFRDFPVSAQSIATSHGQNDNGLFELQFRDERYLPFEGLGAISAWHLSLPLETNRFDFDSLSDVVLHVRYTARDGGDPLLAKANGAALASRNSGVVLLSARHDFPDQWHLFFNPAGAGQTLPLPLAREHFPFDSRGRTPKVTNVALVLTLRSETAYTDYGNAVALKLSIVPPATAASAVSLAVGAASHLPNGSAQWAAARNLGDWQVRADEDDNVKDTSLNVDVGAGPDLHHRLNAALIDDLLLVVGFAWV